MTINASLEAAESQRTDIMELPSISRWHVHIAKACMACFIVSSASGCASAPRVPSEFQRLRTWVSSNDSARLDSVFGQRAEGMARAALADSVMSIALVASNVDAIRLSRRHGADFPASAANRLLESATESGEEEAVVYALDNGADVGRVIARVSVRSARRSGATPQQGWTVLHIACSQGHADVVEILLRAGADPNAKTGAIPAVRETRTAGGRRIVTIGGNAHLSGRTALHVAVNDAGGDNPRIVELLVEHGADVNALDNGRFTPLWLATANAKSRIAEFLKQRGAERGPRG